MSESAADHNDAPQPDIEPVVEGLRGLEPAVVKAALDQEQGTVDPSVGIVIAALPEAGGTVVDGQTFRYYGARILSASSGRPNYVRPHVHSRGQEPYLIIDGSDAEMNTGAIDGERVIWDEPHKVTPGEVIIVQEGQVHSLRNNGDTPFDFAFASPESHLTDRSLEHPEGDRMFTDHLDEPLPPGYKAS